MKRIQERRKKNQQDGGHDQAPRESDGTKRTGEGLSEICADSDFRFKERRATQEKKAMAHRQERDFTNRRGYVEINVKKSMQRSGEKMGTGGRAATGGKEALVKEKTTSDRRLGGEQEKT